MAITRAQQAKQMLREGGRIGFFKGAQADTQGPAGGKAMSPGTSTTGGTRNTSSSGNGGGGDGPKGPPSILNKPPVKVPRPKPKETTFQKFKRTFSPSPITTAILNKISNSKFARMNNAMQRQNYIDSLDLTNPEEKEEYDRIMNQLGGLGMDIIAGPTDLESTMLSVPPSMLATDPMTQFKKIDGVSTLGDPGVGDVLGQEYQDYLNRFETEDRDDRGDPFIPIIQKMDDTEEDTTPVRNLGGLSARIGGSLFNFDEFAAEGGRIGAAEGGIMELARQEMFLGGIAKGLKKAVKGVSRAVKKVAKSPIGKAAILGAIGFGIPGTQFGGIFGKGAFSRFIGQKAMTQAPFAKGTGLKGILEGALGFAKSNPFKTIGGISLLSGLMTPKQDDDEFDLASYYASQQLTPSQSVRGVGSEMDFYNYNLPVTAADGGRIGLSNGGISFREYLSKQGLDLDKLDLNTLSIMQRAYDRDVPNRPNKLADGGKPEPVAKETMPLLDMGGKEMDLREEGGFVPIGRMEKADDVPARLSKNEFVFTADAVRNAGDGDVDKGAEVMYNMMKNLESGGDVSEESQGLEGAREMFQTSKRLEEVL
jgi:hypothetical protein